LEADKTTIDNDDKNLQDSDQKRANKKLTTFVMAGLLVAVSVFTTGWLFGSGKISLRSDQLVPTITKNREAPTEGINELYTQLIDNYDGDISDEDILNGMKRGLVSAANDPYTEFLTAQESKEFDDSLNGTFEGIGAELGKEGSFVQIVAPIKDSPAFKAGIQSGDIITEINGESAADISVSEAVKRIRGPKGETVTLTIIRDGQEIEVPIVRDTITIESVEWEKRGDVGIITVSRFGDDTAELTRKAAEELKAQGVNSVVLDLRGNPGGLLDEAVEMSAVWLPKGSTVLEEKRGGEVIQTFKTKSQPVLNGVPTVVLIDKGSASASEIVAGALRDNNSATLMGVTSYGKGSVQRLIPLNSGGSLKVTIARWFTPAGKNIDKEGIPPDVEVKSTPEERQAGKDPQLEAAKTQLQN
jgi:carboxyl-terminal processing protease